MSYCYYQNHYYRYHFLQQGYLQQKVLCSQVHGNLEDRKQSLHRLSSQAQDLVSFSSLPFLTSFSSSLTPSSAFLSLSSCPFLSLITFLYCLSTLLNASSFFQALFLSSFCFLALIYLKAHHSLPIWLTMPTFLPLHGSLSRWEHQTSCQQEESVLHLPLVHPNSFLTHHKVLFQASVLLVRRVNRDSHGTLALHAHFHAFLVLGKRFAFLYVQRCYAISTHHPDQED